MIPATRRPSRAFTLAELTVYAALLGVLLSGTYASLTLALRYFAVSNATTDLQSQAQQSILHLVGELAETKGSTVVILSSSTGTSGVLFASPRSRLGQYEPNLDGTLNWFKWVCYRLDRTDRVIRRMAYYPSSYPVSEPTTCPYTVSNFPQTTEVTVVGRNVENLEFELNTAAFVVVRISAQFKYSQQVVSTTSTDTSRVDRIDIEDQIRPRN